MYSPKRNLRLVRIANLGSLGCPIFDGFGYRYGLCWRHRSLLGCCRNLLLQGLWRHQVRSTHPCYPCLHRLLDRLSFRLHGSELDCFGSLGYLDHPRYHCCCQKRGKTKDHHPLFLGSLHIRQLISYIHNLRNICVSVDSIIYLSLHIWLMLISMLTTHNWLMLFQLFLKSVEVIFFSEVQQVVIARSSRGKLAGILNSPSIMLVLFLDPNF